MNIAILISCLIALAATKVANDSATQDNFKGDLELRAKTCKTNDACTDAGGICQSKTESCEGITRRGGGFCKGKRCVCCINKDVGCLNEGRNLLVQEVCKIILDAVCKDSHGTGECSILRETCRDRFCAILKPKPKDVDYTERKRDLLGRQSCFNKVCDCNWSPGGCSISKAAPENCACYCKYHIFLRCTGTTVECKNPDAEQCKYPDITKESCFQGNGDCGGYRGDGSGIKPDQLISFVKELKGVYKG